MLFVCVYFAAELAHELCQQLRRYQAAPGHQRCDEGASPALVHPPLPHQTHLCHLRRPLLRYQDTSVCKSICAKLIVYPQMHIQMFCQCCSAGLVGIEKKAKNQSKLVFWSSMPVRMVFWLILERFWALFKWLIS